MKKIGIIGAGYVGMSLATLLSQYNKVLVIDIDEEKVNKINKNVSPINEDEINYFLNTKSLNIFANTDYSLLIGYDYVIICTPTNYDEKNNKFDTSSIEFAIERICNVDNNITIIIKSTIPIGYMDTLAKKYRKNFIFSPEFIREGHSLQDNLYPSRIILSPDNNKSREFNRILQKCLYKNDTPVLYVNYKEAESIKLFSNAYLAMRIAFFNELDTFAEVKNMCTKKIIEGLCLDSRIGNYYNNPSFGYGGYCLPKDTKQLVSNYDGIPQAIISSIVSSNHLRKEHIAKMIKEKKPRIVGIYRLIMKKDSDNFRFSSIKDIIKILINDDIKIMIYEPLLDNNFVDFDACIEKDLSKFKKMCDLIICNRFEADLNDVINKVYTRDIFIRD